MSYFDLRRGPDSVAVQTAERWVRLQKSGGERWEHGRIEVTTVLQGGEQEVCLSGPGEAILRVALRWKVLVPRRLRFLGDHWERGYGDLEWRGLVSERVLPWYFLSYEQQQGTHGYGVKTGARAICFWQVDDAGVTLWLDVRNGGMGVFLGERVLSMATIVTRQGREDESAYEAAQGFCRLMCERPVLPTQPVYGGNNWYYAYGKSSHEEILDDSKLISDLASNTENRPYMVIDDGWQLCHIRSCNGGPWRQGNYLFPNMGRLANEMKEIGVRPGIWMRPLLSSERVPESWVLSQSFQQTTSGLVLDPSVAGVLEHIREDVQHLRSWGYELIKHDFSTFDLYGKWGFEMGSQLTERGWHFADRSRTSAEIILALYRTLAEAAGEALVLGCNTIGHLGAGLFQVQRTGDDTSGKEWERTRLMGINTLAFRMPQHNSFFACDADCVGLTKEVPWELNRQWLDLLARSGTPLFVSAAAEAVGPEQQAALSEAFRRAAQPSSPAEPLDWLDTTCPASWRIDGEMVHYNWYASESFQLFS